MRYPDKLMRVPTATTRPMRPGETQGVGHFFITEKEAADKIAKGEFLEYFKYNRYLYGTLLQPVLDALKIGKDVLLEVDVRGAREVLKVFPDTITIFIRAADAQELRQRLIDRNTEQLADIEERVAYAEKELIAAKKEYAHLVVNPTGYPERAIAETEHILGIA